MSAASDRGLSDGEAELLIHGLADDVSFEWALICLGVRQNPPATDAPPDADQVAAAFASFEALIAAGFVHLGRIEHIDPETPPPAPVRHIAEPIDVVRERVERACAEAKHWSEWSFSCWLVTTDAGDAIARQILDAGPS